MTSNLHAVRIALGGVAVLAAAAATSACGSEQAVEPDPATVISQPKSAAHPSPSSGCSYTADQMQRRIDAGRSTQCGTDESTVDYSISSDSHHPL